MVNGDPATSHIVMSDKPSNVVGRFAASVHEKTYLQRVMPLESLLHYKPPAGMDLSECIIGDVSYAEKVLRHKGLLSKTRGLLSTLGLPDQQRTSGTPPPVVEMECRNSDAVRKMQTLTNNRPVTYCTFERKGKIRPATMTGREYDDLWARR